MTVPLYRIKFLAVWIASLTCVSAGVGDVIKESRDSTQQVLNGRVRGIFESLEKIAVKHGWKSLGVPTEIPAMTNVRNLDYVEAAYRIRKTKMMSCEFLVKDLTLVRFSDYRRLDLITGTNGPLFDKKMPPKMPKSKVIEAGTEFMRSMLNGEVGLENPILDSMVEFQYPNRTQSQFNEGVWTLEWRRMSQGYIFRDDRVHVTLSESYGPFSFFRNLPSKDPVINFVPIEKEKILDAAFVAANQIRRWKPAGILGGRLNPKPIRTNLFIVNPNHILEHTDVHNVGISKDLNSRLAWVIWYEWFEDDSPTTKPTGEIQVWMDAENQKFLGGDYVVP